MSFNLQMGILSFRQELGGGVPADWVSYYSGNITSRLTGAIYAIYLDSDCIEYQTQEQIYTSFEKHPNPQFTLVSGVSSVFSGTGGIATVNSSFGGNVNTPLCTIWTDVYVNSTLSVDIPNDLKSDTLLSWKPHAGLCAIEASFFGSCYRPWNRYRNAMAHRSDKSGNRGGRRIFNNINFKRNRKPGSSTC